MEGLLSREESPGQVLTQQESARTLVKDQVEYGTESGGNAPLLLELRGVDRREPYEDAAGVEEEEAGAQEKGVRLRDSVEDGL